MPDSGPSGAVRQRAHHPYKIVMRQTGDGKTGSPTFILGTGRESPQASFETAFNRYVKEE